MIDKVNELFKKSPRSLGKPINNYVQGTGKQMKYNLFSWITGLSEDIWISFAYMNIRLQKYGYTSQEYYDVVVLGISEESMRPKCRTCGKYVSFESLSRGYRDFCNLSCTAIWGNKVPSKIKNVSKALTGKKLTKEHRESCSKAAINRLLNGKFNNGYFHSKKGYYKPNKSLKEIYYLSSWELEFMKLCDLDKSIVSISSPDFRIPYNFDGITRNYLPDFVIMTDIGKEIIVEIKPKHLKTWDRNLIKSIAGKKYSKKNNKSYIVITEDELFSRKNDYFSIFDYFVI